MKELFCQYWRKILNFFCSSKSRILFNVHFEPENQQQPYCWRIKIEGQEYQVNHIEVNVPSQTLWIKEKNDDSFYMECYGTLIIVDKKARIEI